MKCRKCGKSLRAFHYYRDNGCWTYCEDCGKPYQACYAAPYRTIELIFSGIQREGVSLTVEIEKWPSLEHSSLCWYEWNEGGGVKSKTDLAANYMREHTVEEFIDDYILKENEAIKQVTYSGTEEFLNRTKAILAESGVFQSAQIQKNMEASTNTVTNTIMVPSQSEPMAPVSDTPKVPQGSAETKGFFATLFGKK